MQKIEELKNEPTVGKFYSVPCAAMVRKGEPEIVLGYIPIIGVKHSDKQLGVSYEHYHVDARFCDSMLGVVVQNGKTNNIVSTKPLDGFKYFFADMYEKEIVYKRRKCKRAYTGIEPPRTAAKYWSWYREQIGKSCKGKKCPHLGQDMQEIDGLLVCPLHGLYGDKEKEVIIDRFNKEFYLPDNFNQFLSSENIPDKTIKFEYKKE